MPLSEGQKHFLEVSIAHLLDFSDDATLFSQEESALTHAVRHAVNQDHGYYWIREIFLNPTHHLQKINDLGGAVTLGEVQAYIIKYVTRKLKIPGHPLAVWKENEILETIPPKNYSITLIPIRREDSNINIEYTHPYELELENTIYTATIQFTRMSGGNIQPYVKVVVARSASDTIMKIISLGNLLTRDSFRNDESENKCVDSLKLRAKPIAEQFAATQALNYLKKCGLVSAKLIEKVSLYRGVQILASHSYYFNQLKDESIHFSDLLPISEEKAYALIHPMIIKLLQLQLKEYDFKKLINFSLSTLTNFFLPNVFSLIIEKKICVGSSMHLLHPFQAEVANHPVYHQLLCNKSISMHNILSIKNRKQAKFFLYPMIVNFIQKKQLPFSVANNLSPEFALLASHSLYHSFFATHPIPLSTLSKMKPCHYEFLLGPKKAIDTNSIAKNMANLINNGTINFDHIPLFFSVAIRIINKFPILLDLIREKILEVDDIVQCNDAKLIWVFTKAYAQRFYNIYNMNPSKINLKLDTMETLLTELASTAEKCIQPAIIFKFKIAICLMDLIKQDIKKKYQSSESTLQERVNYNQALNIIEEKSSLLNPVERLNKLIAWAKEKNENSVLPPFKLKKVSHFDQNTLFSSHSLPDNLSNDFFKRLIVLSSFVSPEPTTSMKLTLTNKN